MAVAFAASAGVAALLVALVAGPLEDAGPSTARIQARLMAVDPPQLWRAEALSPSGAVLAATYVCADTPLASTFVRGLPEINGEPCRVSGPVVLKPKLFAARCEAFGRRFAVSAATVGDLTRDFRMDFALAALEAPGTTARQIVRYTRLGTCPSGWTIGEQARAAPPR
jgi:hypothetical protein